MPIPDIQDIPAAWTAADMAGDDPPWRWTLAGTEIAELEAAAEAYLASGRGLGAMSASAFPLPTLGPALRRLRDTLIGGRGFELIRGLLVGRYTAEESAAIFLGLGAHVGNPRSQNAAGHLLGHVRDVGLSSRDHTTRIYQTSERQHFHTDSSDAVALLCLKDAMEGGESLLVSSVSVYNAMRNERPDLAALLFEPIATDRRGEIPPGQKPYFRIPVFSWHDGRLTTLYHRQYIDSAARFADAPPLTAAHVEALDLFDRLADDPRLHIRMRLEPGDMQFVYNHTMLHDRTAFRDWPEPEQRRHLLRLWLSLPGDRPLPEAFAERYGATEIGNRGGIVVEGTELTVSLG